MPMPLIRALGATLLLLLPLSVTAQPAALPEPVTRALTQAGIPESAIGVYVQESALISP